MIKKLEPGEQWMIEYREKYYKNRKRFKEWRRQYHSKKYKSDLKYNLNRKMAAAIWHSLKGNKAGRHWETLVGYTLKDLIKKLKKTIPEGYYWNDFFKGDLHIDHIIPISAHNFTKTEHTDFKRCWALKNLQLLPAEENLIKSNKLSRPFQLALQI